MTNAAFSVAMTSATRDRLADHLLQHFRANQNQEDLCFALWAPSTGRTRRTAIVSEIILPESADRRLHGVVSFNSTFFDRVLRIALERGLGIAFIHSHPFGGWQDMSKPDVAAETMLAPRVQGATGLPLVGLTMGIDGSLSARFWEKVGHRTYEPQWCATVRVLGAEMSVTYADHLAPVPEFREELKRTYSAWGNDKQHMLTRLRIGIVGLGSVGCLIAEAIARMGFEDIVLIDFDRVKRHNLDRLVHATVTDIGQLKVDITARSLRLHATSNRINVDPFPLNVCRESGFRAALDCDVIFSCVDRPWPRAVLNMIAYAHLIPVIDGGIRVGQTKTKKLRGADWRAHVVGNDHACLECLRQYDPADVSTERAGLLDDPEYIEKLPQNHFVHRNENVFPFAMNAAGLQVLQFLVMTVGPGGVHDVGPQIYHLVTGTVDKGSLSACKSTCLYPGLTARGDVVGFQVTDPDPI